MSTRCERRSPVGFQSLPPHAPTIVRQGSKHEGSLAPTEMRLVALCQAFAGPQAAELLDQVSPERVADLKGAASKLAAMERSQRLAHLSRLLNPPQSPEGIQDIEGELESAPSWYGAAVCRFVPADVRGRLARSTRISEALRVQGSPHPALVNHARRFALGALTRE